MKKILILNKNFDYWKQKLSSIKDVRVTSNIFDKEIEIIFGHEEDILSINFRNYPKLKWIQVLSAGISNNLIKDKSLSKFLITTSKGIHGQAMFEYVLQGLLVLKNDNIFNIKNFNNWNRIRRNLSLRPKQKILLLGLGNIGKYLAEKFSSLDFKIDAFATKSRKNRYIDNVYVSINEILLKQYSVIISTLPLTINTKKLINKNFLNLMNKEAIFINLGRGGTVDEIALSRKLKKKEIGGAILDVHSNEPIKKNFLFKNLDNCLCSPHISGYFNGSHDLFISKFEKLFQLYLLKKLKSEVSKSI